MPRITTCLACRRALLAGLLLATLGACGLKGPLTLPEQGQGNVVIRSPASTPPAPPAPPAPANPAEPAPSPPGDVPR